MFKINGEKSPEGILEHGHAKQDNGQSEANLVGDLGWVTALGFIGHVLHLTPTTKSPHLNILRNGLAQ
jgi:hypothetical protein